MLKKRFPQESYPRDSIVEKWHPSAWKIFFLLVTHQSRGKFAKKELRAGWCVYIGHWSAWKRSCVELPGLCMIGIAIGTRYFRSIFVRTSVADEQNAIGLPHRWRCCLKTEVLYICPFYVPVHPWFHSPHLHVSHFTKKTETTIQKTQHWSHSIQTIQ